MIIKVDNREQNLITQIKQLIETLPIYKNIQIEVEALPLGDIIIHNPEKEEDLVIIERKSINDLFSSIKDGRYEEQSFRLNGLQQPNHNIIYLIEGDINRFNRFKDNKTEKLTLYSAIFSLNYFKGFSVIRTFSLDETALFVCNSANKLKKGLSENKKPYYQYLNDCKFNSVLNHNLNVEQNAGTMVSDKLEKNEKNEENKEDENINNCTDKDYISVVKKVKKENITVDNIDEIMLCQIPGISSVTALAIIDKYKSLSNLILSLNNDENCLNDISYKNSKEQVRKISKTSIQNIIKYLIKK
jgi:ERCC4-type nuclease